MEEKKREDIALFRYSIILLFIDPHDFGFSTRKELARKIAKKVFRIPYSSKTNVNYKTIRNWIFRYKRNGFNGLKPKSRCDSGKLRIISSEVLRHAMALRKEDPKRSTKKIIEFMETRNLVHFGKLKESTLARHLKANGFDRKTLRQAKDDNCYPDTKFHNQWMLDLLQGRIGISELERELQEKLAKEDIDKLLDCVFDKPLRYRNRAMAVLAHCKSIPQKTIMKFLIRDRKTIESYIKEFEKGGVEKLLDLSRKKVKKHQDPRYIDAVFTILHAPPSSHGINRTTWKMQDLHRLMEQRGLKINRNTIGKIIKDAGYRFLKAKNVLTSTDPYYHHKLHNITNILSNLGSNEKFFSIDEFGPFAVKIIGGRSLVAPGEVKVVPQRQKSKGSLIVTGALELSTNQITHFYSNTKNTTEMIKLLEILLQKYVDQECIYLSWDPASWHTSKQLHEKVDEINSLDYKKKHCTPTVKLAPLPSGAQFLNVIESVFSGMARAIIHNSNYQSVNECKKAIDRYFFERNQYFKENPKRAGNKIWGKERTAVRFSASNNCKDPRYQNPR